MDGDLVSRMGVEKGDYRMMGSMGVRRVFDCMLMRSEDVLGVVEMAGMDGMGRCYLLKVADMYVECIVVVEDVMGCVGCFGSPVVVVVEVCIL